MSSDDYIECALEMGFHYMRGEPRGGSEKIDGRGSGPYAVEEVLRAFTMEPTWTMNKNAHDLVHCHVQCRMRFTEADGPDYGQGPAKQLVDALYARGWGLVSYNVARAVPMFTTDLSNRPIY